MHDVGIYSPKVNFNGDTCALDHPIGASGTRIIVTLLRWFMHSVIAAASKALHPSFIGGGEVVASLSLSNQQPADNLLLILS